MKITNLTQRTVLATEAIVADTFLSRLIGLLNRGKLTSSEALVITRCQSIHMFFMRFAIDVIFINDQNRVVGLVENIKPFQMSPLFWKADRAVELAIGSIVKSNTKIGDILVLES